MQSKWQGDITLHWKKIIHIKKARNKKYWGLKSKGMLFFWCGIVNWCNFCRKHYEYFSNIIELTYWTTMTYISIHRTHKKIPVKGIFMHCVHCTTIYNSQVMETVQVSNNRVNKKNIWGVRIVGKVFALQGAGSNSTLSTLGECSLNSEPGKTLHTVNCGLRNKN